MLPFIKIITFQLIFFAFSCLSIVIQNAHSPSPMSAEDLLSSYGKQWRADIENEPSVSRLAQLAIDNDEYFDEPVC